MEQEPTVLQREDENRAALPRRLYIEPTSLCNLNCVMCFRKGWIDETTGHMPAATFASVLDSAAEIGSLEEIFFGGMGEPLFHPRIADMVRACSGIAGTALVTNGTLLSPQAAEALVSAGVGTVWV